MHSYYPGVDYHKSYSVCTLINSTGKQIEQKRIANTKDEVIALLAPYTAVSSVMEAGRNWEVMHDWLEETTDHVSLAHPLKVKAIASAKVKTDKIDSGILAQLLRADLLPTAYIPDMDTRYARATLRQRMFYVNLQTAIKNRITTLIDKHLVRTNTTPPVKGLFCKTGIFWLKSVVIPDAERTLLNQDIATLESLMSSRV